MEVLMEDIMLEIELHKKVLQSGFYWPTLFKDARFYLVMNVKEFVIFLDATKFL